MDLTKYLDAIPQPVVKRLTDFGKRYVRGVLVAEGVSVLPTVLLGLAGVGVAAAVYTKLRSRTAATA